MGKVIVTTGRKSSAQSIEMARQAAEILHCQFIERQQESVEKLKEITGAEAVLVAKKQQYILHTEQGELFFHPSMAHLRVKNLRLGIKDHLVEAMGLQAGMSVLDCTMGMGADSIVASYVVTDAGRVVSLEVSPVIAFVISYGMKNLTAENYAIHEAMRRIEVVNTDYLSYLKKQADKSFDIVYFDPMFRYPIKSSSHLKPLRTVSDHSAVPAEAIIEAKRVARKRVVLKENSRSLEFSRLGFLTIDGGKYSRVAYGYIDL